jgi:phytoene dehydrogenase-like protein
VLVLERRERVGGACTLEQPFADPRYVVSPCAYVAGLLDKLVISELELRRRGIEIRIADPELFIPFDDGSAFVQFLDEERTDAALREMGVPESDVQGLRDYNELFDRARRMLRLGDRDAWVGESPSRAELEEMLGGERELTDLVFGASVAEILDEHFSDQRIKDALCVQGLIAAYGGPKDAGTAAVHLMHHMGDLGEHPGSWGYVTGGIGRISFAICEAAIEAGAAVACGVPIGSIDPGEGVTLEDGTEIRAPVVLCNADPKVALHLLEGQGISSEYEERLRAWRVRSPVMKLNAAVTELPRWTAAGGETWPARGTMNVTHGLDSCQRAFERCERGELAVAWGEIYSQSASDPSVAPEGKHVISVFSQYAPAEADGAWESMRDGAARELIAMIERRAPGFEASIEEYELLGPPDIEKRIGLTGGNIFQGECFPDQMWDRRLAARTPVEGVYLCGAATHPGGSVLGLNGRNAAMAVLADRGIEAR